MSKLKNFSKINPVNQAKLFLLSSLATVMVTVNFNLFQPIVANAMVTEQTTSISDEIDDLTQVRLAGPFNETSNQLNYQKQKVQVKGVYQAGDLVQIMLNGTTFVGVIPNSTEVGVQMILPEMIEQGNVNVSIEGTIYHGYVVSY